MIRKKFHKILEINGIIYKLSTRQLFGACAYCDAEHICDTISRKRGCCICYKFNINTDCYFIHYDTEEIS